MENYFNDIEVAKLASFASSMSDNKLFMYNKQYKAGSTLFVQGEFSKEMYILTSGSLEIIVDDHPVAIINQRGVFFGEMAAVLNEPRNATVKSKEDCICIIIPANYVNQVLKSKPEIGYNLIRVLAKRLKDTTKSLTTLQKLYFLQKEEINKLNGVIQEKGIKQDKTLYEFMLDLDLITKEQLNVAKLQNEENAAKGIKKTIATILIDNGVVTIQDVLQVVKLYKENYSNSSM